MSVIEETYDVCVVGAGHAGCEAALACARMGLETIIFTVSVDSIAMMPCNPNIWFVKLMLWVDKWELILIKHLFSRRC
mgnify:CR=1 FL=1